MSAPEAAEFPEEKRRILDRGLSAAMALPSVALIYLDEQGHVDLWNGATEKLTGLTESEALGREFSEFLPEHSYADWNKMAAKVRRGRDVAPIETQFCTASGAGILVQISSAATRDESKAFSGYVVHLKDVSRLALEVQRARRSSAEVAAVVQTVPDGIISLTASGIIQAFNPSAERLFGFRPHEALGCSVEIVLPETYKAEVVNEVLRLANEAVKATEPKTREIFAQRKDGSCFACELTLARLRSDEIESAFVGVFRDISERKEAEKKVGRLNVELREKVSELGETLSQVRRMQSQLVEAEKMASLGALVAGVAHEINTPIGICLSASTLLADATHKIQGELDGSTLTRDGFKRYLKTAGESTDLVKRNIRRASDLVGAFKKTAVDQSQDELREFNLGSLLADAVTSVSPLWRRPGHAVELECPENIIVYTSAGGLVQIMTNLISNAVTHAFKGDFKGTICIQVACQDAHIEIQISDNGAGMPEDVCRRIFEPFFTTNRAQGGTGLGLHVTFNLATQALRGSITVDSSESEGSQFLLRFPARIDKPVASTNDAPVAGYGRIAQD